MLPFLRKSCLKLYYKSIFKSQFEIELEERRTAETKIKAYSNDKEVCLETVRIHGLLIKYVNFSVIEKDFRKKICLDAVKNNSFSIKYIRDFKINIQFIDDAFFKELCLEAVKNDPIVVREIIPFRLLDRISLQEICLEAVKNDHLADLAIEYILRTKSGIQFLDKEFLKKICLEAVKKRSKQSFRRIVQSEITTQLLDRDSLKEICLEAVKNDGTIIKDIKEFKSEILDREICSEAIKNMTLMWWKTYYPKHMEAKNTLPEAV